MWCGIPPVLATGEPIAHLYMVLLRSYRIVLERPLSGFAWAIRQVMGYFLRYERDYVHLI
jgi:hypothetical protein